MKADMEIVVGAAIVREGRVLAARRTAPRAAAGRWEFPGGKVEPGETTEQALARELREELGCEVEHDFWLDGKVPLTGQRSLIVAVVRLAEGEPEPHEHDQLQWLAPHELDDVDWLEADRPFVEELRALFTVPGSRL